METLYLQYLKILTNRYGYLHWCSRFCLTTNSGWKFRESTVRFYAETYGENLNRSETSKLFLRKINKNSSFVFNHFCLLRSHSYKKWFREFFHSFLHLHQQPKRMKDFYRFESGQGAMKLRETETFLSTWLSSSISCSRFLQCLIPKSNSFRNTRIHIPIPNPFTVPKNKTKINIRHHVEKSNFEDFQYPTNLSY